MSGIYKNEPIWLTLDVELLEDSNFNLINTTRVHLNYADLIQRWIDLCARHGIASTCFVLGSFAKKHPELVKTLHANGHEIASHGWHHRLVYQQSFDDWKQEALTSKNELADLIGTPIVGYRSPSWSMPHENRYYEALCEMGFTYSSSFFPFKTNLYGQWSSKVSPFAIDTPHGSILEIPMMKFGIPFSGGFYLRAIPAFIQKYLLAWSIKSSIKPIFYIHPYELQSGNFMTFYNTAHRANVDRFLAFFSTANPLEKLGSLIQTALRLRGRH